MRSSRRNVYAFPAAAAAATADAAAAAMAAGIAADEGSSSKQSERCPAAHRSTNKENSKF